MKLMSALRSYMLSLIFLVLIYIVHPENTGYCSLFPFFLILYFNIFINRNMMVIGALFTKVK